MNKQKTVNLRSTAQLCQTFRAENNHTTRQQLQRLSPRISQSSLRHVCTTTTCQQRGTSISKKHLGISTAQQWKHQTQRYPLNIITSPCHSSNTKSYSRQYSTLDSQHPIVSETHLSSKEKSTTTSPPPSSRTVLSAALEQSDVSMAHSLADTALQLLRRNNPRLAWECYTDLASKDLLRHVTTDQFKQLIKQFNHRTKHAQGLEYVLTLVEDMKHLGFQVGHKEKLLVMRLLGMNGKLKEMEKVFEDLGGSTDSKENILLALDPSNLVSSVDSRTTSSNNSYDPQKPYSIILSSYQEHASTVGPRVVAEKSMSYYSEMLDLGIRPSNAVTRVLMENIRLGGGASDTTELVWNWFWSKIGMNVGGKSRDLEPSLYREMVMYFTGVGRPEYALEVNDIMTKKNMLKDGRMMTALIHKVGRAGDIEKSLSLLNDMMLTEGLVPDRITFNALIDIHTHKKPKPDFAGASRMYKMMQEIGLQPDIYTYGTLIDMFGKEGDLTMVRQLFSDLKSQHIAPTQHIFSSLLECFINNDDQQSALDVLRILRQESKKNKKQASKVPDIQPNTVMYNILIKSYVKKNDLRRAFLMIDLAEKGGLDLNAQTFTPVISHYARLGDVDGANMVLDKMESFGIQGNPYTYASLLQAYAKAGDMEKTEQLVEDFAHQWRPNEYTFNSLLYVYVKNNETAKVFSTYRKMLQSFVKMTEHTYGILMYFYSQRREPETVEALMKTMQSNDIKPGPVCWSILMQSYFRTNRSAEARQVMEQMVQAGVEPTWVTWTTLINGLVQDGELDLAESVLQKTLERRKVLQDAQLKDIEEHFGGYAKLANVNTKTGRHILSENDHVYTQQLPTTIEDLLDQRLDDIHQLPRIIPSSHVFTPLIRGYTQSGQFDKARGIFMAMQQWDAPIDQVTYSTLMKLYLSERRYDVVETIWTALRTHNTSSPVSHVLLDGLGNVPLPRWNSQPDGDDSDDDRLLLTVTDDEDMKLTTYDVSKQQQAMLSPFILSIYMDALIEQDRYEEIDTLWTTMQHEGYVFDEQNWNRYIVSLVKKQDILEACTVTYRHILEPEDADAIQKHNRPGDKTQYFMDDSENNHQLHRRTCLAFAEAFDIAGHNHMGEKRLRSLVLEKINQTIRHEEKMTTSSTTDTTIE
ncbi:hypothetical protein BC941DRAFT_501480 [Chlamydoabsidia padenii]|nr:hypothetical protein BC941DRAFT_501480 [Chlamydoabsidia padenii]